MTVFHTSMDWCFLFKNQTSVGCGFGGDEPKVQFLDEIGSVGQQQAKHGARLEQQASCPWCPSAPYLCASCPCVPW